MAKRQEGSGPSISSSETSNEPRTTVVTITNLTNLTTGTTTTIESNSTIPFIASDSAVGGLQTVTPTGLPLGVSSALPPSSILTPRLTTTRVSASTSAGSGTNNTTSTVTVYTHQATVSVLSTSVIVASTVSVTPSYTSQPTGIAAALAQSQSQQVSLIHKCIIIASTLGGTILLLLIAFAISYCLYKRRRERRIRKHLGFDPNESPPLTSLAPLPLTSPGIPPGASTHLSTGPRNDVGQGLPSMMGGIAVAGARDPRENYNQNLAQDSEASINTFSTRTRDSGPILTHSSPTISSQTDSPPRSPPRLPSPQREIPFSHVPAIAITPDTPARISSRSSSNPAARSIDDTQPFVAKLPVTLSQSAMRSTHDVSLPYSPPLSPQSSTVPKVSSLGRPSIDDKRMVSSLYSTDDLGLGNLMPGSGISERILETRASSGVFPEPGDIDDSDDIDGDRLQGKVGRR